MELSELKSVNSRNEKQLLIDGWTVEKLATTTMPILAKSKGVGLKTAGLIIAEAQFLIHVTRLEANITESLTNYGPSIFMPKIDLQSVKMSPRVRRAKASKKG